MLNPKLFIKIERTWGLNGRAKLASPRCCDVHEHLFCRMITQYFLVAVLLILLLFVCLFFLRRWLKKKKGEITGVS